MKFTPERLLRMTPLAALLVIINEACGTTLNPNQIRVKQITSLGDRETKVRLEAFKPRNKFDKQVYKGEADFTYNRLDVGQVLGFEYSIRTPLPSTTQDVLEAITETVGVVFDENDFELEVVQNTPYTLKAKPESLRWVGQVELNLNTEVIPLTPLQDIITNTELDGLHLPLGV